MPQFSYVHIWEHMRTWKPHMISWNVIWDNMITYEMKWDKMRTYENIWDQYNNIWEHMRTCVTVMPTHTMPSHVDTSRILNQVLTHQEAQGPCTGPCGHPSDPTTMQDYLEAVLQVEVIWKLWLGFNLRALNMEGSVDPWLQLQEHSIQKLHRIIERNPTDLKD